jgi:hypothetical protein
MSRHGYSHGVFVPDEAQRDFAFADTVVALDEDLAPLSQPPASMRPHSQPPPSMRSGPPSQPPPPSMRPPQSQPPADPWAYHSQPGSVPPQMQSQMMAQMPGHQPGLVTSVRGAYQRSTTEMKVLWTATEDASDPRLAPSEEDPFVRLAGHLSRMRTLWSFFEWDREDVMRAAWIGVAVFVVVATVGAFALQR